MGTIQQSQIIQSLTEPPSLKPAPPTHINGVDGLRGLAALIVLVYHCFTLSRSPELRLWHHVNLLRMMHDGWAGVSLFLVLSGFCLFWPYARNPEKRIKFADFMHRRVRRIVPAYYASLLFVSLAYIASERLLHLRISTTDYSPFPNGLQDVILHLLLLHSLTGATLQSWNVVTWSLGLEWTWYLVFPLAVWLYRRIGAKPALLTIAGLTIVYRVGLWMHFGPAAHLPQSELYYGVSLRSFVVGRLFEFGIGMYVAWWLANRTITRPTVLSALVLTPALLLAAHVATPVDTFLPVRDLLYGTAFAMLLLIVVAPVQTLLQRILAGGFLRNVGEYSYSLYLFHLPLVAASCAFLRQHGVVGAKTFFGTLLFSPIILLFAKLAYLCFEKPFMNSLRPSMVNHKPVL